MRRCADELSPAECRVMQAVIDTRGGNIARVAGSLHVTYQAVANTLSSMYDKLGGDLDGNRTMQALVDWYYRTDAGRRLGAFCLAALFCVYTFNGGDFERAARRSGRGRRNEYEYIID
ncbi:hypothetical protein [uncultured Parabacteroides sp.]|uniref:hypothetical protein n=1 Tax=uncultured Parabacteroides sp. TaxID=512312 RepID=UPI00265B3AC0|nr:hypothetical protein [uncultured Parabacteroides sp.]